MQPFLQYMLDNLPPQSQWILMTGLDYHSEIKIYNAILQLEEEVLRPLKQKKGIADPTYIFMMSVKDMLYQAAESLSVIENLKTKYQLEYEMRGFFQDRSAQLQQVLTRFETLEELGSNAETMKNIMEKIRAAAADRRKLIEEREKKIGEEK